MYKFIVSLTFFLLISSLGNAQLSVGGTITSADTAVCANSNSGTLTLSGHTGNILRWEYSLSGFSPWTPIAMTSSTYNFTNLSQSISFRAVVQVPSNTPAYSTILRINVYNPTVGGTISGLNEECYGNFNFMQLLGSNGSVLSWEKSLTNGATWNTIASSADSTSLHQTIISDVWYRVHLQNGACPQLISDTLQIAVVTSSVGGTISGIDNVCQNANSFILTLGGSVGDTYLWQTAASPSGPWVNTSNTGLSLSVSNLNATQYYRVRVQNGNCPAEFSSVHGVTVSQASQGGNISGISSLCEGDSGFQLNLNNSNGTVLSWESSTDNGGSWNSIVNNSTTLNIPSLVLSTDYRAIVENGACPSDTSSIKFVQVHPLPMVSFTYTNGCEETDLSFQNTTANTASQLWDFGNGNGGTTALAINNYVNPGTYVVQLIITSPQGCVDSLEQLINIYVKPNVDFTFPATTCFGSSVPFTNGSTTTSGTITSYFWDLDDTQTSTQTNPSVSYSTHGDFDVALTATTNFGCTNSVLQTVTISPLPSVDFNVADGCEGTLTSFQNLSTIVSGSMTYNWSFGDGNSSTLVNPQVTYASDNTYNVLLEATSNENCVATNIQAVTIHPMPVINFTALDDCQYDSIYYNSTVTNSPTNTFLWNFGDGSTSTDANPAHLFSAPSTYQSQLIVTSTMNCSSQITDFITVFPLPAANFNVDDVCSSDSAEFQNLSSISNGTLSYAWDFGNNTFGADNNPTILYAADGIYTIELIATSDSGCSDTTSNSIEIFDAPVASFTFVNACDGLPVAFTNNSTVGSGSIQNVLWDFGDNSNSTLNNPEKTYLNDGSYTTVLQVTSSNGCVSTVQNTVEVYESPIANFTVDGVCFGEPNQFVNSTSIGSGTFTSAWNFGDNTSSIILSPNHTYSAPSDYLTQLIVTSDQGCQDMIEYYAAVYEIPTIYAGEDTTTDKGFEVQLIATGGVDYTWTPALGLDNPQIANPIADPDSTTTYTVYVSDINGCANNDDITVFVTDAFRVIPYNILTPDGNNKNDTWIVGNIDEYPNNTVNIFNELGHEVFVQESYDNSWEGRNKSGELLPDGTYYYVLRFGGSERTYQGDILLIRNLK